MTPFVSLKDNNNSCPRGSFRTIFQLLRGDRDAQMRVRWRHSRRLGGKQGTASRCQVAIPAGLFAVMSFSAGMLLRRSTFISPEAPFQEPNRGHEYDLRYQKCARYRQRSMIVTPETDSDEEIVAESLSEKRAGKLISRDYVSS